jgi:uncharacterized protein YndB with AHSA1/START domain
MRHAKAETMIDAPIEKVWEVIMDLKNYPDWNPFTVEVENPEGPKVGAAIRLHVRWNDGKGLISPEFISRIEPPAKGADGVKRAVYGYKFGTLMNTLGLVRSNREQVLEERPGGKTHYQTRIDMWGLLAGLTPLAKVQDGFDRQTAALKKRCEQGR